MASLVPLVASTVTAAGFGTAVALLVVRRKPVAATPDGGAAATAEAPVKPGQTLADIARHVLPAAYARMLQRQILLAGRPSTWTMGRILVAKPLFTGVLAVLALWFINGDPSPFRI